MALGSHLIKAYSKTQAVIAKSSGESELYGIVKISTEALGLSTLLEDFGVNGVRVRVGMDANAAMGIVQRKGLNKLRHVELDVLWVQEQQARRLLPLRKVPGTMNPSDMMTKNITQVQIDHYVNLLKLKYAAGRAQIAQNLHYIGKQPSRKTALEDFSNCAQASQTVSVTKAAASERSLDRLHIDRLRTPITK